ncbi:MAG TPA: hypothetical protein PK760_08880, partial [Flavobacteriales bacterium]|nr:hypothetical protein [Flavobacteriales bacterium]
LGTTPKDGAVHVYATSDGSLWTETQRFCAGESLERLGHALCFTTSGAVATAPWNNDQSTGDGLVRVFRTSAVGVGPVVERPQVSIFPNPALPGEPLQVVGAPPGGTLEIVDVAGRLACSMPIRSDRIHLPELLAAHGTCLLRVKDGNGTVVFAKVLILR